jgi:hypothetical protein
LRVRHPDPRGFRRHVAMDFLTERNGLYTQKLAQCAVCEECPVV